MRNKTYKIIIINLHFELDAKLQYLYIKLIYFILYIEICWAKYFDSTVKTIIAKKFCLMHYESFNFKPRTWKFYQKKLMIFTLNCLQSWFEKAPA